MVIDANILIALADAGHVQHRVAIDVLAGLNPETPVRIHPVNAGEFLAGYSDAERAGAWDDVVAAGIALADLPAEDEALLVGRFRYASRQKIPDVCAMVTAAHLRTELFTFDHRLRQSAEALGIACRT